LNNDKEVKIMPTIIKKRVDRFSDGGKNVRYEVGNWDFPNLKTAQDFASRELKEMKKESMMKKKKRSLRL